MAHNAMLRRDPNTSRGEDVLARVPGPTQWGLWLFLAVMLGGSILSIVLAREPMRQIAELPPELTGVYILASDTGTASSIVIGRRGLLLRREFSDDWPVSARQVWINGDGSMVLLHDQHDRKMRIQVVNTKLVQLDYPSPFENDEPVPAGSYVRSLLLSHATNEADNLK